MSDDEKKQTRNRKPKPRGYERAAEYTAWQALRLVAHNGGTIWSNTLRQFVRQFSFSDDNRDSIIHSLQLIGMLQPYSIARGRHYQLTARGRRLLNDFNANRPVKPDLLKGKDIEWPEGLSPED